MKIESTFEVVLSDEELRQLVVKAIIEKAAAEVDPSKVSFRQQQPVERNGGPLRIEAVVRVVQKKAIP